MGKVEIVTMTPAWAKKLLAMNTDNFRNIRPNVLNKYAKSISEGKWDLTGEAIKVTNGVLIDGQHRLGAIIKAGRSIETVLITDVVKSAANLDRGMPRTIGNFLQKKGHKDANAIASIVKFVIQYDTGQWGYHTIQQGTFIDADIIEYADAYKEELHDAISVCRPTSFLAPFSQLAAIIHIGSGRIRNPQEVDEVKWFIDGLVHGANLVEGDPPLTLRTRLIADKTSNSAKLSRAYVRWIMTMAWNKTVMGDAVSKHGLKLRSAGPSKQEPPTKILVVEDDG